MKKYRLTTRILDERWPADAISMVLPVPPTTANQKTVGLLLPCSWSPLTRRASNAAQTALFVEPSPTVLTDAFAMDILVPDGQVADEHFAATDMPCLAPQAEAQERYSAHGFSKLPERTRLMAILQCAAKTFHVDPPMAVDRFARTLDINAAFIQLLRLGGIRSAHYSGYFFAAGSPLARQNEHSWVDTLSTRGYENWDIAHSLRRGLSEIASALNPIEGVRFALSTGRDLLFDGDFAPLRLPHLCGPRWVLKDGRSQACEITVLAEPM